MALQPNAKKSFGRLIAEEELPSQAPNLAGRMTARIGQRTMPRWLHQGKDPDYRFTLANERTFLAWLRTSFAMSTAAIVLYHVAPGGSVLATKLGPVALGTFATAMAAFAFVRWKTYEIAMRLEKSLPIGIGFGTITGLAALASASAIYWIVVS